MTVVVISYNEHLRSLLSFYITLRKLAESAIYVTSVRLKNVVFSLHLPVTGSF